MESEVRSLINQKCKEERRGALLFRVYQLSTSLPTKTRTPSVPTPSSRSSRVSAKGKGRSPRRPLCSSFFVPVHKLVYYYMGDQNC